MSQLDQLPPDQRAALSLILRQGRSYEDVARVLRIEPEAVRERALAALQTLGPRDAGALPPERRDEIADYLLGQQPASRRGETREYLEESPGGRAWARVVSGELRGLSDALPEIPSEAREPEPEPEHDTDEHAAAPAPPRARRRRPSVGPEPVAPGTADAPGDDRSARAPSGGRGRGFATAGGGGRLGRRRSTESRPGPAPQRSRVGQAVLLLGLGVIVAALIILILEGVIFGGGSSSTDNATLGSSSPTSTTSTTSTTTTSAKGATSTPRIVAQITFAPTGAGGNARALANLAQSGNQKAFALVASGLAPTKGFAYAVWLYNPGGSSQPLGFIDQAVGSDGRAAAEGVLPSNAAQFKQIVVTRETASKPTHPGTIVLTGQVHP